MRSGVVAAVVILGTFVAASASASVGTQQWSALHLKVGTAAPQAAPAPGPRLEVPSTLVGRPDDALRGSPAPGTFSSLGGFQPEGGPPKEKPPGAGTPVPEPGTISLLAMGLIGAGLGMRRRNTQ